eukprot:14673444-Alexandrium_andersonii.AAC.1
MGKCKAAWNVRLSNSVEHLSKRVREVSWQKALTDVGDRHPGESQKQFRKRLVEATVAISDALVRDVARSSPEQRA